MSLTRRAAAVSASALAFAFVASACVKIPEDTAATFAPARPDEPDHYRRRADAPSPEGFVSADGGGETVGTVTISVRSSGTSDAGASAVPAVPAVPVASDGGVS